MPTIEDEGDKIIVDYTEGDGLFLVLRCKALAISLDRLRFDRENLEFELSAMRENLARVKARSRLRAAADQAPCHFCRTRISTNALVCAHCRRVQPAAYDTVAQKDKKMTEAIKAAMLESRNPSFHTIDHCVYCRSSLSRNALVCAACQRIQPTRVMDVAKEDLAALAALEKVMQS